MLHEQPLLANLPRDIQPDQGRCSWNRDFGEPPGHAFDNPTLCRGWVGILLPSHSFVLLGSMPIVLPGAQIENCCVNPGSKPDSRTPQCGETGGVCQGTNPLSRESAARKVAPEEGWRGYDSKDGNSINCGDRLAFLRDDCAAAV